MRIGIGLPATLPGVQRTQLLEWARRAEARGFSTLAANDRLVYDNLEPLIALSAAAAVTTRIRLATTILIAPLRANPVLLAKQAASLNHLADGRLTLGLAPGGRQDDYTTSDLDFHTRGRTLDHQLTRLHDTWNNPDIGPHHSTPRLLTGGFTPASFTRAATHADGWIAGGGDPDFFRHCAQQAHTAWHTAHRTDTPHLTATSHFVIGAEAEARARRFLLDYFAFAGPHAREIVDSSLKVDEADIKATVDACANAGADELILFSVDPDPDQVDRLADIVL